MIPRTARNQPRLQTPCAHCSHPEWDHYLYHFSGSDIACDQSGCQCAAFRAPTDSPTPVGAQQNIDTSTHQHTTKEAS